jgi:hypothetical protein
MYLVMENALYLYMLLLGNSAVKFEQIVGVTINSIIWTNFRQLQNLIGGLGKSRQALNLHTIKALTLLFLSMSF